MSKKPRTVITDRRKARIQGVLRRRQKDLRLVLSNIHDPHNVSAIYRSCDAFGVARVHLHYTTSAFPVLGKKSSASARKWVETVQHENADDLFAQLRSENMQVLATGFSAEAKPVTAFDLTRPTAIILGNEHDGVEPELKAASDGEIYIPMQGMIQSLNVSVAAAVSLYEAWRQRDSAGMYDEPRYTEEELAELEKLWCSW